MRIEGICIGRRGTTIDGAKMPEEDTPSAEMYFGAKRSHESTLYMSPARCENEAVENAVLQDAKGGLPTY